MKITELLDSDVDLRVKMDTDRVFRAYTTVNGRKINIDIENNRKYGWSVMFGEDGNISNAPTGNGGALQVYSAVVKAIQHVIQKHHPEKITFHGMNDTGQAAVYKRIASRIKGYTIKSTEITGSTKFELDKISEGLGDLAKATDEAPKAEQMFSHVVSMMKKFTGKGARVDAVDFKRPYIAFFVTMAEDFDHAKNKDRRKVFPTVAEVEAEMGPFFRKVIRLADSGNFEYSVYYAEPRPYGEDIDELKALFTHKYPDTII